MKKRPNITFVGPCRKINPRTGDLFPPFSPKSRSGAFLRAVLSSFEPAQLDFDFTNVIDDAVKGHDGRERNPTARELTKALTGHALLDAPYVSVLVALSDTVRTAFDAVEKETKARGEHRFPVVLHFRHPSYMMRRPKSEREAYSSNMRSALEAALAEA